ncbi:hypothetical protein M0802_012816 [Mischocyttarus mexicanus]|nr:hypothetical protein M0802_012816 [Mischocyttarus mexicanus]
MISNHNTIDEFSLATSNFDMSFAAWLVIFIYNGHDPDYCHDPPFNIFHLRFDSKMIVRCNRENILREWYSIDKNLTEIDDIASWNLENGITMIVPSNLYDRRNNLKGTIMRVVTANSKNSLFVKVKQNGKLDGICGRIFEELCVALNFTFRIVSKMEEYGVWDPKNKTWSGAMGELISERADISVSDFTISKLRLDAVDFTLPFFVSKTSFFIQEPQKFSFQWSSFFLTFSYSIWISMFGVLIVASILLVFLKKNVRTDRKIGFLLSDNFLEIWGIFCQQGLTDFPDNCSLRIVYFSIFILAVVLWAAYSATMISFLTTPNVILPFRSLEGFANDGTYKLYVFRGSHNYDMFSNSKDSLARKIRKLMIEEEKLSSDSLMAFTTICKNKKIAFYTSEAVKENINFKLPCDIVSLRVGQIDSIGIILTKNNPFTDVINFQLQKFMDNGRLRYLKEKLLKTKYTDNIKHKPVPIASVISLIFFILIGFVLMISDDAAINEFSLATSTFDMSFAAWLVVFIYDGVNSNYCRNPPGNIFHLRYDSEMLVRCNTENILREWYSIDENQTKINDLAIWNLDKGVIKTVPGSLYDRRSNLHGLVMKAVLVKNGPFIKINKDGQLDGVFGRISRELCTALNFSFNVVSEVEDYGTWNKQTNTWTGAMGEMYSGRADISISDFSMTSVRLNFVDFTLPLLLSDTCIYIQDPQIFTVKWSSYFLTFTYSIWISIFGVLIVASALLIFVKIKNGANSNLGLLLSDNFIEICGIFCQQGIADFPYRSSLRIIYFSMCLMAFVLSAAYSAALISFLTSVIRFLPFRSLEGFVEDGTYKFSVFRGTAQYDYFAICEDKKLAIYTSEEIKKTINLEIPCNVVSIKAGLADNLAIILSKHNPFTGVINFQSVMIASSTLPVYYLNQKDLINYFNKKMEMTTMVFKWTRALSRKGFTTSNLYFSELYESAYYVGRIVRPHYIVVISNYNAINEFALATSNFDMSFAVWLVLFIYKGKGSDYCRNPPGNIFHLRFDSEMLVRCGTENILREWYSIGQNQTEIDDVAKWSLQTGIIKMAPDSLYERRFDLHGLEMKAVIVKDGPFINVNKDGQLDGVFGRILQELCVSLNFSFNVIAEIEEYGRWDPKNEVWTGAIAEISSKRADVSLSDFSMTSARLNVVDFTFPLLITKNYLHIQEPNIFAIEWSTYFLAFSRSIWICTYGILILASILLIFLKKQNGSVREIGHLLSDNFLEVWGILCQQGLTDFPDRSSLRITYFSMFIFCYVLLAAYSAALISYLTTVIHIVPFRSLESFIADGTYRIAVFRGTSDYDMFAHSTDPLSKQVMRLMLDEDKLPVSLLEGFMQACKDRKLAIYTYNEIQKDIIVKLPCNIISIEAGAVNTLSIILSKHNPFTNIINFHLQKFINNGVLYRLKEIAFEKKFNEVTKHHNPVPITSVISIIFFILIATSNFDMSFGVWLVIFIYNGYGFDYCHNPPGNIFHLKYNSEMLVLCGTENILREWYSINNNRTEIIDVAKWNMKKGITDKISNALYEKKRDNLQGLTIKAVIVKDNQFISVDKHGQLDGVFGKIVKELSFNLNFTFDIVSQVAENGIWNPKLNICTEAIDEICSKRVEVALADFTMSSTRLSVIDFTIPLAVSKNCIYIQKPRRFVIKWSSYFLTFTSTLWIAVFGILIVSTILLVFIKKQNGSDRCVVHLLSDNFLEIWGIICQQGLADFSGSSSLRIAYFSIFILAVILSAAYSAALISFLTSNIQILPFRSLETFVEDGTYQFAVYRSSSDYDMFTNSKDPIAQKLKKLMIDEEKLPLTTEEAFKIICKNKKIAMYSSFARKEIINSKIPCSVVAIPIGRMESLAIILSKYNPFTEVINYQIVHTLRWEKNGTLRGLFGDIITELGQAANFTLNIVEFVKEYGRWDENNQIWTGAVGEIVAGRADIAIGEFSLTNSRLDVVDYILPVLVSHMHFYIKNPLYDNVKWNGYFNVFDSKIWIFIIVIISTAPSLVSVLKMNDIQEHDIYQIISMVLENYLQFWGIFCQQGLAGFSYRLSLRLAYFSTFISAFVVFAAYSGTLVSFITNSIQTLPFRTFEELVEDGTYQLAVYKGASDYDMFAYANDSTSKRIMKIMRKEDELPTTALEAILMVNIFKNFKPHLP